MPEPTWVVGMYVYRDSKVTIRSNDEIGFHAFPGDELTIGSSRNGVVEVQLSKGIYRFAQPRQPPLAVEASDADLVIAVGKDPPPDPTGTKFRPAFGDVTHGQLKTFFPYTDRG